MTSPSLSTGGARTYNLQDVIANLNDDVDQTNAPDLTDDTAFTDLTDNEEMAFMVDTVTATEFVRLAWGTAQWGLMTWA